MKKWEAKLPGGKKIAFESDTPREYMRYAGHDEYALTQIAQVPSANVSQVRHGRWCVDGVYVVCSVCNRFTISPIIKQIPTFKYCPNCGAKMDLKEG